MLKWIQKVQDYRRDLDDYEEDYDSRSVAQLAEYCWHYAVTVRELAWEFNNDTPSEFQEILRDALNDRWTVPALCNIELQVSLHDLLLQYVQGDEHHEEDNPDLLVAFDLFEQNGATNHVWINALRAVKSVVQVEPILIENACDLLIVRRDIPLVGRELNAGYVTAKLTEVGEALCHGRWRDHEYRISHAAYFQEETRLPLNQMRPDQVAVLENGDGRMSMKVDAPLRSNMDGDWFIHIVASVSTMMGATKVYLGDHSFAVASLRNTHHVNLSGVIVDFPIRKETT